jgi:hypothetical protein
MRAAEHHLTLGQLDGSAVALVVEAVTGSRPDKSVDDAAIEAIATHLTDAGYLDREAIVRLLSEHPIPKPETMTQKEGRS